MSDIAAHARRIADSLLPDQQGAPPPSREQADAALAALRTLTPVDQEDERALAEAGETVLILRDTLNG